LKNDESKKDRGGDGKFCESWVRASEQRWVLSKNGGGGGTPAEGKINVKISREKEKGSEKINRSTRKTRKGERSYTKGRMALGGLQEKNGNLSR